MYIARNSILKPQKNNNKITHYFSVLWLIISPIIKGNIIKCRFTKQYNKPIDFPKFAIFISLVNLQYY